MREIGEITWSTNIMACHAYQCPNTATHVMVKLNRTYFLCTEHEALERYIGATENSLINIIPPVSVHIVEFPTALTPEEKPAFTPLTD
jgi:hypothetical protein